MTRNKHWSDEYAHAPAGTLEQKIYLAACYSQDAEPIVRLIGKIAFEQHTSIFHAAWLAHGRQGHCQCSPCSKK